MPEIVNEDDFPQDGWDDAEDERIEAMWDRIHEYEATPDDASEALAALSDAVLDVPDALANDEVVPYLLRKVLEG